MWHILFYCIVLSRYLVQIPIFILWEEYHGSPMHRCIVAALLASTCLASLFIVSSISVTRWLVSKGGQLNLLQQKSNLSPHLPSSLLLPCPSLSSSPPPYPTSPSPSYPFTFPLLPSLLLHPSNPPSPFPSSPSLFSLPTSFSCPPLFYFFYLTHSPLNRPKPPLFNHVPCTTCDVISFNGPRQL